MAAIACVAARGSSEGLAGLLRRGRRGRGRFLRRLKRARVLFLYSLAGCFVLFPCIRGGVKRTSSQQSNTCISGPCLLHFATLMPTDLCTISKAANHAGVARSTIQRWIKAGRLKKMKGGAVSLAAVARCKEGHVTGRPCGQPSGKCETLIDELSKPFFRAEGLRRLERVLVKCALHWRSRGKAQAFSDAVIDAISIAREEEIRASHSAASPRSGANQSSHETWEEMRAGAEKFWQFFDP